MPSHLKHLVRARMDKTGESYQRALEHVRAQEKRAPEPSAAAAEKERPLTSEDTAFSIAVVRAEEGAKPEAERLFEDPYAALFAEVGAHAAEATQRFLDMPMFRDGIRLRTRFIDDFVREGLAAGLDQVVVLGAGFDMRALRMPEIAARRARVYEIDSPRQLDRKQSVLARHGVKLPKHLSYVPFDYDARDIEAELPSALEAEGFRPGAGALFVWEGVIGYISGAAIDASLRFMASAGGPGTRLVFTYADERAVLDDTASRTRRAGFSSMHGWGSDELWPRYLPGDPHPNAWVVKLGTALV
jgi:methyltransferase (TIGR00027 family)